MRLLKIAIVILSVVSFSDCMSEKDRCETNISQGDVELFCSLTLSSFNKLKREEESGNNAEIEIWKSWFIINSITCLDRYEKEKECEEKSKVIPYIWGTP